MKFGEQLLIDGFSFTHWKWAPGERMLLVDSSRLEETIKYCRDKNIRGLAVSPVSGYLLNNINFLDECTQVVAIYMNARLSNMSGLFSLPDLVYLSVKFQHQLDFTRFRELSTLSTEWNEEIHCGLVETATLKDVLLQRYRPKDTSHIGITELRNLEALHFIQSSLERADGVEDLKKLKSLEFSYCPKLKSVGALAMVETLEFLELDHCARVDDFTILRHSKRLKKLLISDCGTIPSISFINQMPNLEFFSFVNTNILDGDMTPCFGLKYAGFLNKRHYSHTYDEVREIIEERVGDKSLYR